MSDKPWKKFEREAGELLGGRRFWANSGEALDCEGPLFVGQCKYTEGRRLSYHVLEDLAVAVQKQALPKFKAGVVIVKESGRRGAPTLVVMTAETFRALHGPTPDDDATKDLSGRGAVKDPDYVITTTLSGGAPAARSTRGPGGAALGPQRGRLAQSRSGESEGQQASQ